MGMHGVKIAVGFLYLEASLMEAHEYIIILPHDDYKDFDIVHHLVGFLFMQKLLLLSQQLHRHESFLMVWV